MNNDTTFYIVRHGETTGNVLFEQGKDVPDGDVGPDLTALGVKQAQERAIELKDVHFDAIYSSDFIRARRTAEIIRLERKLEIITTKALRERVYGSLDGKMTESMRKEVFEIMKTLSDEQKLAYKHVADMESGDECVSRYMTFLREIEVSLPGKTILVGSHGEIMRTFLVKLGWAKYNELSHLSVTNTGYMILRCDGVEFFLDETHEIHKNKIPVI